MAFQPLKPLNITSTPILLTALVILVQILIVPAAADYSAQVSHNEITVHIGADFNQGVTIPPVSNTSSYGPFARIPVFNNATVPNSFSDQLSAALKAKTPQASVSGITFSANSNGTRLHYDLSFQLVGVTSVQGELEKIDMSWRSFKIADDVMIGNVSLNFAPPTYLTSKIVSLLQLPASQQQPIQISRLWYWDGQIVERTTINSRVLGASLFNFTSLNQPLQDWKISQNPTTQTTTYQWNTGFNLTYAERFVELGESGTSYSNALYNIRTTIEAPWNAQASGDTLIVESSAPWSVWLMVGLIVTSVVIVLSTVLFERRFSRTISLRKQRK